MIDYVYENNFLDSSRETGKAAILKRRQTRGISTKSLEIYAVFDVKKRASRLITLSDYLNWHIYILTYSFHVPCEKIAIDFFQKIP